jgi:hypothetical protein
MTSPATATESRCQRWWCAGLDADARAEAQALHRRLAGRDGLWLAAALAAGLAAAAWGLNRAGVPVGWALPGCSRNASTPACCVGWGS